MLEISRRHDEEEELGKFDTYRMYWRQAGQKKTVHNLRGLCKWLAEQGLEEITKNIKFTKSYKEPEIVVIFANILKGHDI